MKDEVKIICPHCGREYLPVEIFIPKYTFGNPLEIVRNSSGKIIGYTGDEPDYTEIYICDECGSKLKIKMNIAFDVSDSLDINSDYSTTIIKKQNKVNLF